ncbi:MAG: DNA replication/repair protein RecF [Rhodospirillaceae bacterium]|nr:DNA replication/repair protein RecF [Rhodospirillaceae bacterium]
MNAQSPHTPAGHTPTGTAGVVRLDLTSFRSYPSLRLDVALSPIVLTGANGAGKTNLLEAVSFLAPGRGLRGARLMSVARTEPEKNLIHPWAVSALVTNPDGEVRLGTGLATDGKDTRLSDKRAVHVNGMAVKGQVALSRHLGVVWLTPAMDRIFLDAPSSRRKFLDRLVTAFDPDQAGRIAAYEHAHRQRMRLLRDGIDDKTWFAALEDTLARYGIAIAAARADMVSRLNAALSQTRGPFPGAIMTLVGDTDRWLAEMPAVDVEEKLRNVLGAARYGDVPDPGPHKTDLMVTFGCLGHPSHNLPASMCSTGEQKALLVSIVLASARLQTKKRGFPPVLLLDEIAAHLDPERRDALFAEILNMGVQAWLTGTDEALFTGLGSQAQYWSVGQNTLRSNTRQSAF